MQIKVTMDGWLECGGMRYRCALGKAGYVPEANKREGDGKTPLGSYPLRRVFWRADKLDHPPATHLSLVEITKEMGWCDEVSHPSYNRLISLAELTAAQEEGANLPSHETLWREEDDCYDIVVELGHNDTPPVAGLGSAIFMHVAKEGYTPTEGCVAMAQDDLLAVLSQNPTTITIAE